MFKFTRKATVVNAADLPAAIGWAMEVNGYLKKTYQIDVTAGVELFGTPTVHWYFETDSLDKISALNQKMLQDKTYVALLEKARQLWLAGTMKDEIVQLP